jgi:hypothetical protein
MSDCPYGISRRELLHRASGGFGAIALAGIWSELQASESKPKAAPRDPLAPQPPHYPAKAERVIFVYSTGGASHVDTFDYKPQLFRDHGKTITADSWQGKLGKFDRYLKKPQWEFRPGGRSGLMISDLFPHLRNVADELCIINSMRGDTTAHDKAALGMNTGSFTFARPSMGAWVSYGLGTENRNLPSFVVMAPKIPYAGVQVWGADMLPACHQGTRIIPGDEPIPNIRPQVAAEDLQKLELDLLGKLNRRHLTPRSADWELDARIRSFETAFGMQHAAPEAMDIGQESADTQRLYGIEENSKTGFGWQCLVARRLAERGVRFIQLVDRGSSSADNWDNHDDMARHYGLAKEIDQPLAGLITDLRRRGMLDSTLVVWATEFGRTPFNNAPAARGREHHHQAFTGWMAGGGVKGGLVYGKTDDYGISVVENKVHVHDFHATILHLLGLNHEKLTFRSSGRDFRLTDVSGEVVKSILA